jgi:hypothetical protein
MRIDAPLFGASILSSIVFLSALAVAGELLRLPVVATLAIGLAALVVLQMLLIHIMGMSSKRVLWSGALVYTFTLYTAATIYDGPGTVAFAMCAFFIGLVLPLMLLSQILHAPTRAEAQQDIRESNDLKD